MSSITDFESMNGASVTVIIVAFNGDRWLPECIHSLAEATQCRLHLVVVDNGGNTGLDRLALEKFEHTVMRTPRPFGFAEANNFALQHFPFDTDAVCFLNQDTRSEPNWLDVCLDCLRLRPDLGAVSPGLTTYDGAGWDPNFWDCARNSPELCAALQSSESPQDCFEVPVVPAVSLVVRTSTLRKVGPFDPIFGSYYEDYDLCRRMAKAGYRIGVCPQGRVAHYSNSSTRTAPERRKLMRNVVRNRVIYQIREAGEHRVRAMASYLMRRFSRNLCRSVLGTPSSQPLTVFLAAHRDLLLVSGRLLSAERDRQAWNRYLTQIGWPDAHFAPSLDRDNARSETLA